MMRDIQTDEFKDEIPAITNYSEGDPRTNGEYKDAFGMGSRMDAVEEEVKLLRAEVHATLMDIREQLLEGETTLFMGNDSSSNTIAPQPNVRNQVWIQAEKEVGHELQGLVPESPISEELDSPPSGLGPEQLTLSHSCTEGTSSQDYALDPNLLASLLRWVELAARYIGQDQLTIFMDLCGFTRALSEDLRELIFRLTKNLNCEPCLEEDGYSKWIELMLQLYGIINSAEKYNPSRCV